MVSLVTHSDKTKLFLAVSEIWHLECKDRLWPNPVSVAHFNTIEPKSSESRSPLAQGQPALSEDRSAERGELCFGGRAR